MQRTGKPRSTVERWLNRFLERGVDGPLRDVTRPPGLEPTPDGTVRAVVDLAGPAAAHQPLDTAGAGEEAGADRHGRERHPEAQRARPHQVRTSRVFRDPRSGPRVRHVVGLHLNPPDHTVVLSVDGKIHFRNGQRGRLQAERRLMRDAQQAKLTGIALAFLV